MRLSLGVAVLLAACAMCVVASDLDTLVAQLAPPPPVSRFRAAAFAVSCFYNLNNLPAWVVALVVISVLIACTGAWRGAVFFLHPTRAAPLGATSAAPGPTSALLADRLSFARPACPRRTRCKPCKEFRCRFA